MYTIQNLSSCDTSTILVAPPSAGAEVSITAGDNKIQLIPSPFVNITLEKNVVNDTIIGGLMRVQLNGTAVGNSFNETAAGCDSDGNPITNKSSLKQILDLARNSCCITLIINCGCDFINGKGRIVSASVNEGNDPTWVSRGAYSIEIELYTNNGSPVVTDQSTCPASSSDPNPSPSAAPCTQGLLLKDLNEQFSITIDEDSYNWGVVPPTPEETDDLHTLSVGRRHVKVAFSISAKGVGGGSAGGSNGDIDCLSDEGSGPGSSVTSGLAAVEKYMKCRIDQLRTMNLNSITNKPAAEIVSALNAYAGGKSYLDFRTLEVNPVDQSMSLTGDIIYRPSGCNSDVFTNITVEESIDNEGNQITISGNIEGLATVSYNYNLGVDDPVNLIAADEYLSDVECTYNQKMIRANEYFARLEYNNLQKIKDIAAYHCKESAPSLVVKCLDEDGNEISLPCVSESPEPSSSPTCKNLQLISRQVSRDYAAGTINFTYVLTNKNVECSTIKGVSNLEIEATHDLPKDNIVETVVPGRGKKGVLIQNLCCLSADRWTFSVNMTLEKSKTDLSPLKLKKCAQNALKEFIDKLDIDPDPIAQCWFVTDHQETLGQKSYKYNVQYTRPSCP